MTDTNIGERAAIPKTDAWADRIAAQQRSGNSVKQFCKEQGLTEGSFYAWRKRLQKRDAPGAHATPASGAATPAAIPDRPAACVQSNRAPGSLFPCAGRHASGARDVPLLASVGFEAHPAYFPYVDLLAPGGRLGQAQKFRLNFHGLSPPHTSMPLSRGTVNYKVLRRHLKMSADVRHLKPLFSDFAYSRSPRTWPR